MKRYEIKLVENAGKNRILVPATKCQAPSGCKNDLSGQDRYYRIISQTDHMASPSFGYFCVDCAEKALRTLKF